MPHALHYECKRNKALAVLSGSPLTLLLTYDSFSNENGDAWPVSRPVSTDYPEGGQLNIASGLCHSSVGTFRPLLVKHGAIEKRTAEQVKALYADPKKRQPPPGTTVWHVTGELHRCDDPDCKLACMNLVHDKVQILYMSSGDDESTNLVHKGSSVVVGKLIEGSPAPDTGDSPKPSKEELDIFFEAILLHSFKFRYEKGVVIPDRMRKHVGVIRTELMKEGISSAQYVAFMEYQADEHPNITPVQSIDKIITGITVYEQHTETHYSPALGRLSS